MATFRAAPVSRRGGAHGPANRASEDRDGTGAGPPAGNRRPAHLALRHPTAWQAGGTVTRRLVLASASPARLRTLRAAGVQPEVRVSGVDEDAVTAPDPAALVLALARAKAAAVVRPDDEDLLVLGCDSLLELDGRAYGKPADVAEVATRWARMAGRSGVLRTGHVLLAVRAGRVAAEAAEVASTGVQFGRPTEAELTAYAASGEPLAVAGGFTVDGLGSWFVDSLDGDAGTVIGLSLPALRRMLGRLGVSVTELWETARRPDP